MQFTRTHTTNLLAVLLTVTVSHNLVAMNAESAATMAKIMWLQNKEQHGNSREQQAAAAAAQNIRGHLWAPALQTFIEKDSKVKLFDAVCANNAARAETLLHLGADPNGTMEDVTPLMKAAELGHVAVMAKLLQRGASVFQKEGKRGFTALHFAAEGNRLGAARTLLDAGADVQAKSHVNVFGFSRVTIPYVGSMPLKVPFCGSTPHDIAERQGNKQLAQELKPQEEVQEPTEEEEQPKPGAKRARTGKKEAFVKKMQPTRKSARLAKRRK